MLFLEQLLTWSLVTVLVTPGLDRRLERTRRLFFHQTSSVLSRVATEPFSSKVNCDAGRVESVI